MSKILRPGTRIIRQGNQLEAILVSGNPGVCLRRRPGSGCGHRIEHGVYEFRQRRPVGVSRAGPESSGPTPSEAGAGGEPKLRDDLRDRADYRPRLAIRHDHLHRLEHIEDDREGLKLAAAHLRPGGRTIVLSPAHQWLFTPFDAAIGHFRRYNRSMLRSISPPELRIERLI